jgi:hypothetical protein
MSVRRGIARLAGTGATPEQQRSHQWRRLFAAGDQEVMLAVVRDVGAKWLRLTGPILADGLPLTDGVVVRTVEAAVRTDVAGSFRAEHTLGTVSPARRGLRLRANAAVVRPPESGAGVTVR